MRAVLRLLPAPRTVDSAASKPHKPVASAAQVLVPIEEHEQAVFEDEAVAGERAREDAAQAVRERGSAPNPTTNWPEPEELEDLVQELFSHHDCDGFGSLTSRQVRVVLAGVSVTDSQPTHVHLDGQSSACLRSLMRGWEYDSRLLRWIATSLTL